MQQYQNAVISNVAGKANVRDNYIELETKNFTELTVPTL